MDFQQIITAIGGILFGGGGFAALMKARSDATAGIYDQVNKAQSELNADERALRDFMRAEFDRRETSYRLSLERAEARADKANAALDQFDAKYRELAADYTMLSTRYMSQAHQIQNVAAIILERDYYKRQAHVYAEDLDRMQREHAAEIQKLNVRIEELEKRIEKAAP